MEHNTEHGPNWWEGGYIRHGKRGPTYMIDRRVSGVRFHISTKCHLRSAALKHLERFEADPDRYSPADGRVGLAMTAKLVLEYRDYQLDVKRVTGPWANDVGRMLADWIDDLAGKDLRKLNLATHIKSALARRVSTPHHRVTALKGFFRWLRQEKGLLKHHEDVSLDVPMPKIHAAKLTRKKVVSAERVRACIRAMPLPYQDALLVLVGTGWHVSELRRFAFNGELVRSTQKGVLAVAVTTQKTKRLTRTGIRLAETLAAAERIRKAGHVVCDKVLNTHVARACKAAEVDTFTVGVLRHSVATWAIEAGAHMKTVSEFLDHQSEATTRNFYVDSAQAKTAIPIMRMLD